MKKDTRPALLPDRYPQGDMFVCDIFDAAPKGDMASMEHPIFSISTKPDRTVRRYESGENFVEITPSVKGLATIHDRDVLIYCISQLMAAINDNKEISQILRFSASELLRATNRPTGGESYKRLLSALERLRGTTITTNIITGNVETLDGFGLIDQFKILRKTREGRMQDVEIKLSDWVFNAIQSKEVLTISRDYFRLRKPLERRLYEIARKHCGAKKEWRIGLSKLQAKCGSGSTLREFRRLVQGIIKEDQRAGHLPDYTLVLGEDDIVTFHAKGSVPSPAVDIFDGHLPDTAYEHARAEAPGWDVRYLEQRWRAWCGQEEIEPKAPERHFVKFCASWYAKRGAP